MLWLKLMQEILTESWRKFLINLKLFLTKQFGCDKGCCWRLWKLTHCLWSICNRCTYHKIISAKLPLWPARGTWHAPSCVALSTRIFPGQCKLWQIPSSCIKCFMLISLILKNQEGLLFCWRALLSDWMIGKHLPSPSHNPSCGHHCPTSAKQLLLRYNFRTSHD